MRTTAARAPLPTSDPIVDLLRELVDEIKGLRADLARVDDTSRGSKREPILSDARFLATIAASVQGHPFTASELLAHAAVDPDLAEVLRGMSARRVGKKLQVLSGRSINSYRLNRISRDETGWIWHLQVVDLQSDAGHDGDMGV